MHWLGAGSREELHLHSCTPTWDSASLPHGTDDTNSPPLISFLIPSLHCTVRHLLQWLFELDTQLSFSKLRFERGLFLWWCWEVQPSGEFWGHRGLDGPLVGVTLKAGHGRARCPSWSLHLCHLHLLALPLPAMSCSSSGPSPDAPSGS